MRKLPRLQQGFSLVEVLVSMVILSVVGLAFANNTIKGFVFMKRSVRQSYASQLALDKLEELAGRDPSTLTAANNSVESDVSYRNVKFTRTTTVTVNADGSRAIAVTVVGNNSGGRASVTTNLPLRGNV